jgi:hypothetical protein
MAKQKLTGWFPATVNPARVGVYQTDSEGMGDAFYSFFDGVNWHGEWWSPKRAATLPSKWGTPAGPLDADHWRGLAEEPK